LCRLISRSEGGGCVSDRRAKPNSEYGRLYAAAVARRQADQIYNLSLTRTATVILGRGARRVIGVGRVKTPTLAIVCRRELEIRNFVPITYLLSCCHREGCGRPISDAARAAAANCPA
jgi:DNA topoisomerase